MYLEVGLIEAKLQCCRSVQVRLFSFSIILLILSNNILNLINDNFNIHTEFSY